MCACCSAGCGWENVASPVTNTDCSNCAAWPSRGTQTWCDRCEPCGCNWKAVAADDGELNALREQVKALELEAERHLLVRLERSAQSWPQGEATDLSAWLEGVTAGAAHLDRDALHQLRVAVTGT